MSDDPNFFATPDPWGYRNHPCDRKRKHLILHTLAMFTPYYRALDLGCHEGFITASLPCNEIHGYELSDLAAARLPKNVTRVAEPSGRYDLVLATGVLYAHYDWPTFTRMIKDHASRIVLTCNIAQWEVAEAVASIPGEQLFEMRFPYREWKQELRVFRVTSGAQKWAETNPA